MPSYFQSIYIIIIAACGFLDSVYLQELLESHMAVLSILKSENYSANLLPPENSSSHPGPLKVHVDLDLRDIDSIDDRKMELKVQLSLRQRWIDSRLQYPSKNPYGYVTLNADIPYKPWTPDIFVQKEKSSVVHSITRPDSFFRIFPNGTVFSSTRISLTVACFMDLRRFPFDEQICDISLGSFSYRKESVVLLLEPISMERSVSEIESAHLTQFRLVGQASGHCKMDSRLGEYSAVYVSMAFSRQLAFYMIQLFLPCTMLVIISWVSFWLGDAMEARLSLTVTVMLTLSTQISGSNQVFAQVSYVTGFSVFSGACLTFAALSIMESATVFFIQGEKRRQLPRTNVIGRVMEKDKEKGWVEEDVTGRATARTMGSLALRIDTMSRVGFPLLFVSFMVAYFGVYLWDSGNFKIILDEMQDGMNTDKESRWHCGNVYKHA